MLRVLLGLLVAAGIGGCAGLAGPFEAGGEQATEQQQRYLDDGVVTFAEYEEAMLATIACVRAQGFTIDVELASDGFYQYVSLLADGFDLAFDACREDWSQQVELAYQESQQPSEGEMPAVRATIRCLGRAGHPPSDGIRPDQLMAFIRRLPSDSSARACADLLPAP